MSQIMNFPKTLLSNLGISHFFRRSSSSDAVKPTALSSLFAEKPSKIPQIPKPSAENKNPQIPKPSAKEKSSLSSIFAAKKPSTNLKLPNKDLSTVSFDLSKSKKPSTNGKLPMKDKRAVVPRLRREFPTELSPEATTLVNRLIGDGYLKGANLAKGEQLEPQQIPSNLFIRHFLKGAAEKFGREHQEVAKWLSGSELKKVALFGCPSIVKKTVFAAKRLRAFFRIQEDVVCRGCKLRTSCKFINKKVGTMEKVVLEDVMRLITVYSLDSVSLQLVIPDELKCSIGKLVKEAISLTN